MTGDLGKSYLKDYVAKTDGLIVQFLKEKTEDAQKVGDIPAKIVNAFVETVRRGKRIRGTLLTLGYKMFGGQDERAVLDASLCVELFHAGVLVHDDIMDRDHIRRGLPTMHKQFEKLGVELGIEEAEHYGISQAINLADAAYYMSWELLMRTPFSPELKITASRIYSEYVLRVVHGQILDVTNLAAKKPAEEAIINVLKYKTAEYTGIMPMYMGAALAGIIDPKKLEAVKKYGLAFGWAFQIQDDILGIYGDEEEFGKPIGSDLREGKNTLLTLYVMNHGNDEQKAFLAHVMGNKSITKDDVVKVRQIIKDCGAYDHVYNLGMEYVQEGIKAITYVTEDKEMARVLESLIVYMMERVV